MPRPRRGTVGAHAPQARFQSPAQIEEGAMRYFVRRIMFFLLTLWAAVTLNFIIPRLQPGDPAEAIVRQIAGQNKSIDPAQVAAVRAMLGVPGGNLFQQYLDYLNN